MVGLVDWDESRADVGVLDLGVLPSGTVDPAFLPVDLDAAMAAADAWEVATCWVADERYSRWRLARWEMREAQDS
ncbi:hypothetical protein ACFWB2_44175 [Streptomyces virginiae]|uniref:hypothetical protein n=1 Tax=Streptomyces virginiae TaxID=1961 RepID=UPI00369C03C6